MYYDIRPDVRVTPVFRRWNAFIRFDSREAFFDNKFRLGYETHAKPAR